MRSTNCASAGSRIGSPIRARAICTPPRPARCISPSPAARSARRRLIRAPIPAKIATRSSTTIAGPRAPTPRSSAWTSRPRRTGPISSSTAAAATLYQHRWPSPRISRGNTTGAKNYTTFTQQFGNPIKNLRTTDINFYAQDTWKLSRKVTFSYGLRYEKSWLPQPTITNPDWPQTGSIPQQNKNFAPRVSLSYSVDDRTVIRAGYGIFYARIHGNMLDTLFLGNGKYQTAISVGPSEAGAPVFPNILPASGIDLPAGTIALQFADPKSFRAPYSQQGTLALEHQFTRDIALTASYIWSRGIGLFTQRDLNLGNPIGNYTYTIQDAAGNNVSTFTTPVFDFNLRPDKRYGKILQVENGGQSWYNALALQLEKRFSHGLPARSITPGRTPSTMPISRARATTSRARSTMRPSTATTRWTRALRRSISAIASPSTGSGGRCSPRAPRRSPSTW